METSADTISSVLMELERTVGWSGRSQWLVPRDEQGLKVGFSAVEELRRSIDLCRGRRVCVQAGGALGIYPEYLSHLFDHVYTFEPNPWLFHCLTRNAQGLNVHRFQAAVGLGQEFVSMQCPPGKEDNQGAWYTKPGGWIPELRLDDLQLFDVDLIVLDIEGGECDALGGAQKTIERCRPIIVVENKPQCMDQRNVPRDWLDAVCASLDYHVAFSQGKDITLAPR